MPRLEEIEEKINPFSLFVFTDIKLLTSVYNPEENAFESRVECGITIPHNLLKFLHFIAEPLKDLQIFEKELIMAYFTHISVEAIISTPAC